MAKKGEKKKNKKVEKIDEIVSSNNGWYDKVIVILVVLCTLCIFYLITVKITINEEAKTAQESNKNEKADIQYEEILVGSTFNRSDDKYFVVYYDMSEDSTSDVVSAISSYRAGEDALPLYVVDMSDPLNKGYASKDSNDSAEDASELRINGVTLVRVKDGNLDKYLEGEDEVIEYLTK